MDNSTKFPNKLRLVFWTVIFHKLTRKRSDPINLTKLGQVKELFNRVTKRQIKLVGKRN